MKFNLETKATPLVKWAGGKSSLLKVLVRYFPTEFKRYHEPFIGGGAVWLALCQGVPAVINDVNSELIELYNSLKVEPARLQSKLDEIQYLASENLYEKIAEGDIGWEAIPSDLRMAVEDRKYFPSQYYKYLDELYYAVRDYKYPLGSPTSTLTVASRFLYLNKNCFNGLYRVNLKREFNVPFGKRNYSPKLYEPDNLRAVNERLQTTRVLNKSYKEALLEAKAGDFIYCDPPYFPISGTSDFTQYSAGGFTLAHHIELLQTLQELKKKKIKVAISNSAHPQIIKMYKEADWHIFRLQAKRSINSNGEKRGEVDEILATNYLPAHTPLSDSK